MMRLRVMIMAVILLAASWSYADYRDVFEREFVHKSWVGSRVVEEGVCIECHTSDDMKEEYLAIPQEWKRSIHFENGVSCHDCHGGDPDDAAVSCGTPHSGFVGTPKYIDIPEMCGKCHIGIRDSYNEGGHGEALKKTGEGPNCVTCHGSHPIQKASIEIINQNRCQKCHSYERASIMKKALFQTEKRLGELEDAINDLKSSGASTTEEEKALFRTHAEFRALFHTIDVDLVKNRADEFSKKLDGIEEMISSIYDELDLRRNFSGFLLLLFASMSVVVFIIQRRQ